MKIKEILCKSLPKRWFRNGIHSLLRRDDARGSADIIYCMDVTHAYRYLRISIVNDVTK